ncbi:hypothetical protein [Brevundimonas sp.]|jgi:hypothetical protein|uniref:hypothetical protein n=1 Tax=Brevundimonas sp. TaxID=1871086 RepID=UPI002627C19F|nr:hypothetical protein [Brevundimonas sp.]
MNRAAFLLTAVLIAMPGLAAAQQVSPPPAVLVGPVPIPDEAATARYMADFTALCLDTGGERAAVRAAVARLGWTEASADAFQGGEAVDLAAWDAPDGRAGGQLLTSASAPGEMADGLIVRTCILQPAGGSAGPRARLQAATAAAVGLPGRPTAQGLTWILSGSPATGFRDEMAAFTSAGSTEAGFALGLERPILLLTLVGNDREAGLALLRLSPE